MQTIIFSSDSEMKHRFTLILRLRACQTLEMSSLSDAASFAAELTAEHRVELSYSNTRPGIGPQSAA